MLFSGVEAQQPTAARRCGSFRIAAVQLLSEAADVERGRISKIQKHCVMRLRAAMPVVATAVVRRDTAIKLGGPPNAYLSEPPTPPYILVIIHVYLIWELGNVWSDAMKWRRKGINKKVTLYSLVKNTGLNVSQHPMHHPRRPPLSSRLPPIERPRLLCG